MIKTYTSQQIEERMIFLGMERPDFHLVGIRSQESIPDRFDDHFYILADHSIQGNSPYWCTTNPGKDYLLAPLNPGGTALLVADKQYTDCFTLGKHKGKDALIQCDDLLVYRDNDLDQYAEELGQSMTAHSSSRIDIHRANNSWTSIIISRWSAGCQVIANPNHFQELLSFCRHTKQTYFTYTLLHEFNV